MHGRTGVQPGLFQLVLLVGVLYQLVMNQDEVPSIDIPFDQERIYCLSRLGLRLGPLLDDRSLISLWAVVTSYPMMRVK